MIWNLYDAVNATCNALIVGLPLICFPMLILHSVIHRNDAPQAIATADTIAAADAKDLHSDNPQAIATIETIDTVETITIVDTNNNPHATTQKSIVRSLLGVESLPPETNTTKRALEAWCSHFHPLHWSRYSNKKATLYAFVAEHWGQYTTAHA